MSSNHLRYYQPLICEKECQIILPLDVGPLIYDVADTCIEKFAAVREVEEVSKSDLVAREILLLAQDLLINVEFSFECSDLFVNFYFVGFQVSVSLLEDSLDSYYICVGVETRCFNGRRLFKASIGLQLGRDEWSALVGVFGGNVSSDGATLKEEETIIILKKTH